MQAEALQADAELALTAAKTQEQAAATAKLTSARSHSSATSKTAGAKTSGSSSEDAWAKIPWLTDLTQARRVAAGQGKPILLWEMDGHPLGCV